MDNSKIILVGTGGQAALLLETFHLTNNNSLQFAGFLERAEFQGPSSLDGFPVFKESEETFRFLLDNGIQKFIFGIGNIKANPGRWNLFLKLIEAGLEPKTLIHPSATVSERSDIGDGTYIGAHAIVQPYVSIGPASTLHSSSIVEHHSIIKENVLLAPGVILCGNVTVEEHSFVGANATVIHGLKIGKEVTIAAGTVVIRDIPDKQTVAGNPARVIG